MKYHYITQVIIDLFGFHTKEPFIVQEIVIRILVATLRTQDLKNFRNVRKMLKLGGDVAQFPLSSLGVKLLQQRSKMTIKQISELSGAVQFCFFFFFSLQVIYPGSQKLCCLWSEPSLTHLELIMRSLEILFVWMKRFYQTQLLLRPPEILLT